MKKLSLLALILLVAVVFCTGCEGDADEAKQPNDVAAMQLNRMTKAILTFTIRWLMFQIRTMQLKFRTGRTLSSNIPAILTNSRPTITILRRARLTMNREYSLMTVTTFLKMISTSL